MNYVYVLACSQDDFFYEQFYLSASSFRFFNPDAYIILLVDQKTKNILIGKRSKYEKIVSEIKILSVPSEYTQKEASRWIKTSIHRHVSGDFLYIDCDTIIADGLNITFPSSISVGAVLDTHAPLSGHHLRDIFQNDNKRLGFSAIEKTDKYFNGGLIYCRDCAGGKEFFEKWHSLWIKTRDLGNSQDMPSLNQANYECDNIITELDGSWNCQISHNGLSYLYNAKIIHYYATSLTSFDSPFIPASEKILQYIKANGTISPEIMKMLENPKSAFSPKARIISDQIALDVLESAFFSKLLWLRRKHQKVFNKLNDFVFRIKKPKFIHA